MVLLGASQFACQGAIAATGVGVETHLRITLVARKRTATTSTINVVPVAQLAPPLPKCVRPRQDTGAVNAITVFAAKGGGAIGTISAALTSMATSLNGPTMQEGCAVE